MYLVVPAVLVGGWLLLMVGRRRVGWVFFVAAFGLSGLLFPLAVGVQRLIPRDPGCPRRGPCWDMPEVGELIVGGFLGLWCAGGLLVLTLLVELVCLGSRLVARWRERTAVDWREWDEYDEAASNNDAEYDASRNPRGLGG
jgi:uncharacterized membrane protein